MNPIDRAYAAVESRIMRVRLRSRYFDHFCRALLRFWDVQGGRLAAAIAYYGFFAVFALLLIGYSIFGLLLMFDRLWWLSARFTDLLDSLGLNSLVELG